MLNLDNTDNYFQLIMPTNVNGIINTVKCVLDKNRPDLGISMENIKERVRGMFLLDFHVFPRNMKVLREHSGYWVKVFIRITQIYRRYITDLLKSYGCNIVTDDLDIKYTLKKYFGIEYRDFFPDIDEARIYDHEYIMNYVSEGDISPTFNLYSAIGNDELEQFVPRVYGYQLTPLQSVYNKANVNMVVPYHIRKHLENIWRNDQNAKEFIHDSMWEYFDDDCIEKFIRYLYVHIGKIYRVGILNNSCILYNNSDTNVVNESNLNDSKKKFTEFIERCYKCS